jgi:hypothetical protein
MTNRWEKMEKEARRQLARAAHENRVRAGEDEPADGEEGLVEWDEMTAEERAAKGVGTQCSVCDGLDGKHEQGCANLRGGLI